VSGAHLPVSLVQIEPTSRCNLSCQSCLRGSHPDSWLERDLDASTLKALLVYLPPDTVVHLQGWGEPLLLPGIFQYISLVRGAGMRVSLTSNATLVDREMATGLIRSGLDSLTFSMAGFANIQDDLRGPGTFIRLEEALEHIKRGKQELGSKRPCLAISYLLTPATIKQLPRAVSWCARRGVSLLAGVHMTHPASDLQRSLQCMGHGKGERKRYKKYLFLAQIKAIIHGLRLELPPLLASEEPICGKNPQDSFFVAADGSVAPCVFLCPPHADNNTPLPRCVFGNLHDQILPIIWNRPAYKRFRQDFARRVQFYETSLAGVGFDLDAPERLDRAKEMIAHFFADNPPPAACRNCLKIQGA